MAAHVVKQQASLEAQLYKKYPSGSQSVPGLLVGLSEVGLLSSEQRGELFLTKGAIKDAWKWQPSTATEGYVVCC